MTKPIYVIGTCALAITAAALVWSHSPVFSWHGNTASVLAHASPVAAGAATTPTRSPSEMMINDNRPLPLEQWDAF